MPRAKILELKLSQHGYERIKQRVTPMTFSEAEQFAKSEILKSHVTLLGIVENGLEAVGIIYRDIKYIVQNNTIVTVYTLY